ncbi:hypothetical protein ACTOB_001413 [Actinoplanes oblitus]|uniref:Uncharacterized protein n=1 Tax=Actinoplanes oblitus TaxID=3040509 RepID=A0ABY8WLZ2_9ACTN|nr:hypothetical protein [Actinoplanes oblitus]WIM97857.1 hypothetical protein ACTOB_001413 [Actinoplanes oblitus]
MDRSLTLVEVIASAAYPLGAGTAPDRFIRRLAALVPNFLAEEPNSPDATGSPDLYLAASAAPRGSGMGFSVTVELPGEQGYRPIDEWWVTGSSDSQVQLALTLSHNAGEPEFDHAIRLLRAHGALPGNGMRGYLAARLAALRRPLARSVG